MTCLEPRVPYKRTYIYLHNTITPAQAVDIFIEHLPDRRTVGYSADDAGLGAGCLAERKIVAYGVPVTEQQAYLAFWAEHYPGAIVEFTGLAEGTMIIDISHWQRGIDLAAAQKDGVAGVICKATQGYASSGHDVKFLDYIKECRDLGLPWGAYHYYRNHLDPILQAQSFNTQVALAEAIYGGPPMLGLWGDFEDTEIFTTTLPQDLQTFCTTMGSLRGADIGIYTANWWLSHLRFNYGLNAYQWFRDYALWLADYVNDPPVIPTPWITAKYWQQGQLHRVWGVSAVDFNWVL